MVATLHEILFSPDIEPQLVADCHSLIEQEVAELSGVSGAAVKLAYKTVATLRPGHIRFMVADLLPQLVDELAPYWAEFRTSGSSEFGDYLAKRADEVSAALLSVTDARAAGSRSQVVARAYRSVRGGAARHIEAALPRVGDLVSKHAS
jgi:Family of unknown function (DUF6918)